MLIRLLYNIGWYTGKLMRPIYWGFLCGFNFAQEKANQEFNEELDKNQEQIKADIIKDFYKNTLNKRGQE